ncbi:MAG: zinc-binding dehydrogenase [Gemmatimonadota bacterium]|nr:zinc-binding dehydrogenase [Gemmatimonadota bacterium]
MRGHGDRSQLEVTEVPTPRVSKPGDVLVRLKAAALNHLDLWTLRGLPGLSLTFPHILGGDGAGVVEAVGDAVTRAKPGDRVMINPGVSCYRCEYCLAGEHSLCERYGLLGEHVPGTLCELIVLPEQNLERIPTPPAPHTEISWTEAAAYSLVTLTAWRMLVTRAKVRPGETVFIWGVGGGVSSTALAIAKLAGARVVVTSSSNEKLAVARRLGADETINHDRQDVVKVVRALTERRGVDVVVENVGEATWDRSLRILGRGGRLVSCGATTGPKVSVDVRRLFWFQWSIMGSTMGSAEEYRQIVELLGQGHLRPTVDSTYPLDQGVDAFHRLEQGQQIGKVVVEIE